MKKRWFLFNGEDPEKRVFYYPARDALKQDLGFISMEQVTDIRKTSNCDFEVLTPNRTYFLQAPSEKEMEAWISALRPHIRGGQAAGGSSDSDALREKDARIAKLEEKLKSLEGEEKKGESSKNDDSELQAELQRKDEEIQALNARIKKLEETYNEELVELKKEYFRACAIGIVQQRKITKDLPPVAELYKRCLDDNTEWKDYVPWIKTTLPKK